MAVWAEVKHSRALMEGRIDSEYYKPSYLELDRLIERQKWQAWGKLGGQFIVGPFGSSFIVENCIQEGPYRYIRGKDVKPFFLKDEDNVYIPFHHFDQLSQYSLKSGDLLVSVVGTLGNVSVVTDEVLPAVFSCKSTTYRCAEIDSFYLCAYLSSKVGANYLIRKQRGAVQTGLNLEDLKSIPVPRFDSPIEQEIALMVQKAYSRLRTMRRFHLSAKRKLEEELGIGGIDLSHQVGYETRLTHALGAGRWDSEFYKPKYQRVIDAVLKARKVRVEKFVPIGQLFFYLTNGHTPLHHDLKVGKVLFLTAEHVSDFRLDFGTDKRIMQRHHEMELARTALRDGDVLVTIKGKVGNCAVVRNCPQAANINQDVALIRLRDGVHPYFFAAWFNSQMGKQLVEQRSTGGINPFLGLGNLRGMPFPVISQKEQQRIGDLVQETVENAYNAERDATNLLEQAKRRVERLIEGSAAEEMTA
jgi:hypothetical protein